MILTSHYMEDIERLCRRIMIIRDGTIVYDGSLQEVVTAYAQHKVVTAHTSRGGGAVGGPRGVGKARRGEGVHRWLGEDPCSKRMLRRPRRVL